VHYVTRIGCRTSPPGPSPLRICQLQHRDNKTTPFDNLQPPIYLELERGVELERIDRSGGVRQVSTSVDFRAVCPVQQNGFAIVEFRAPESFRSYANHLQNQLDNDGYEQKFITENGYAMVTQTKANTPRRKMSVTISASAKIATTMLTSKRTHSEPQIGSSTQTPSNVDLTNSAFPSPIETNKTYSNDTQPPPNDHNNDSTTNHPNIRNTPNTPARMQKIETLIPVYPAPDYLVERFHPDNDVYTSLQTLIHGPSTITLSAQIPLPTTLFDASSIIPPIKAYISSLDFNRQLCTLRVHCDTAYNLERAYLTFLASPPNRFLTASIKHNWKDQFYSRLSELSWTVSTRIVSCLDSQGNCDLEWCFVPRGLGEQLVVSEDGQWELITGAARILDSVENDIKRIFTPGAADQNIWEIQYNCDEPVKYRLSAEYWIEDGILSDRPLDYLRSLELSGYVYYSTAGRTGVTHIDPKLLHQPMKRQRGNSTSQHRPTQRRYVENATGGKCVIRSVSAGVRLCQTEHGQSYIGQALDESIKPLQLPEPTPATATALAPAAVAVAENQEEEMGNAGEKDTKNNTRDFSEDATIIPAPPLEKDKVIPAPPLDEDTIIPAPPLEEEKPITAPPFEEDEAPQSDSASISSDLTELSDLPPLATDESDCMSPNAESLPSLPPSPSPAAPAEPTRRVTRSRAQQSNQPPISPESQKGQRTLRPRAINEIPPSPKSTTNDGTISPTTSVRSDYQAAEPGNGTHYPTPPLDPVASPKPVVVMTRKSAREKKKGYISPGDSSGD
jgi:hypothetical protein